MSVLIFVEIADGRIKKTALELISYGAKIAELLNVSAQAVVLGTTQDDLSQLGNYGVKKIIHADNEKLNQVEAESYTKIIAEIVEQTAAKLVLFSNNITGKSVAPRLSVRLKAGLVSGAVALPRITNGFVVKKTVFSGKAYAHVSINSDVKIITLNQNTYPALAVEGTAVIEKFNFEISTSKIKIIAINKISGEIPLTEAEIVVSAGRGLKGPENWGLVTGLAKVLNAATACSRPVADANWRPHNEHVGQTGTTIAPTLYFAIGISGAIQHLAGVNRSKVIVVINKDAEAPFFKAADYGIIGDAFEILPKLTKAISDIKNT